MNLNELYPSRFLKSADFADDEVRVLTIKDVSIETLGKEDEQEEKPILSFREKDAKPMVLNKTNATTIAKLLGNETDDWMGKRISLYVTDVQSFGEMVPAIRVKTKLPQSKSMPREPEGELFEEERANQIDVGNLGPSIKIPSHQPA